MALPKVCDKPTPKRVAAHLIKSVLSNATTALGDMEDQYGAVLSSKQREEVEKHYSQFKWRIEKHVLGKNL